MPNKAFQTVLLAALAAAAVHSSSAFTCTMGVTDGPGAQSRQGSG